MGVFTRAEDLKRIRQSGRILSAALDEVVAAVAPGVTTAELDAVAARAIASRGGQPAFKGYHRYPATLCASVNDEVVHGIPRAAVRLAEGDLVGLDLGVRFEGFYTDHAVTVPVGSVDSRSRELIAAARAALALAAREVRAGLTTGTLGAKIQAFAEGAGFAVVRDLVGHGIGRRLHEEPKVPNFGRDGTGATLLDGTLIAVEPMLVAGTPAVETDDDGWTVRTRDGARAAHFEQTMLVTARGAEIITPYGPHLEP